MEIIRLQPGPQVGQFVHLPFRDRLGCLGGGGGTLFGGETFFLLSLSSSLGTRHRFHAGVPGASLRQARPHQLKKQTKQPVLWDSSSSGGKAEITECQWLHSWVLKGGCNDVTLVRTVQGGEEGRERVFRMVRADRTWSNDVGNRACGSARDYCFISLWISVPGPETAEQTVLNYSLSVGAD